MSGPTLEPSGPAAWQAAEDALDIRNDVLVAPDGWLFLHGGMHRQFAFLLSEQSPRPSDVCNFWSNLEGRANYCHERRLPYQHIVFPSKPVVMTRALPAPIRGRVQSLYRRSFLHAAPPHATGRVFHPVEELCALDATDLPFPETDTHPTDPGNALVAQALLSRWNLGYAIGDHFERESGTYEGDLCKMLGVRDPRPRVVLRERGLDLKIHDNRRFLPSNGLNIVLMHSPRSATPLRLAVVGDSFFTGCLRFLAPVFRDILYLRGPGFHEATLDSFAPHAVMTGNAERYLARVLPDAATPDVRAELAQNTMYRPDEAFASGLAAQLSSIDLSLLPRDVAPCVASPQEVLALRSLSEAREAELARIEDRLRTQDQEMRIPRQDKDARIKALRRQVAQRDKRLAEAALLLGRRKASLAGRIARRLRRALENLRRG